MRILLLVLLLAGPLPAAVFVPPDDAKPLFRRDLLPLDTDTMRALSGHLTTLARREIGQDPVHWRATAQLLAIATRLDPANRPARDLGRRLARGEVRPPPDNPVLMQAAAATWHIVDWLRQPEAGPEGQLLAHQLLDALQVVDPRHPLAGMHDAPGEAERWQGVVADLPRFRAADPPPAAADPPSPPPPPPPPPVSRPPIALTQASVLSPLFLYDQDSRMHLRIARIAMDVHDRDAPEPLTFALSPAIDSPLLDAARARVRRSLEQTWPHLPLRKSAQLDTGGERYASRNATAISGPASLLLHAALVGSPLRGDLVFLADLKEDGTPTRPRWSWDYLRALRLAEGGRLIVPPDLQPELRAMIALESPEFFQKWEVLVADSLEAALHLGSAGNEPDGQAEASRLFAEFRQLAEGKPIGPLCVNEHVRERFGAILEQAPYHFSSSMLLLQGNLERPTRVEREVAARIARSAVDALVPLSRAPLANLSPQRIEASCDAARGDLKPFVPYFRREDVDLDREAGALIERARTLGEGLRTARRNPEGTLVTTKGVPIATLQQQLHDQLTGYLRKLAPYTGEMLPTEPKSPPEAP